MPVWTSQWRRNGTCVSTAEGHGAVVPPCPDSQRSEVSGKLSLQPFQETDWNLGWWWGIALWIVIIVNQYSWDATFTKPPPVIPLVELEGAKRIRGFSMVFSYVQQPMLEANVSTEMAHLITIHSNVFFVFATFDFHIPQYQQERERERYIYIYIITYIYIWCILIYDI